MDEDIARDFAALVRALDAAMAIVTTAADGEQSGCLVGFHSQCSIEPPRYAVWLSVENHTYRVGQRAEFFAVHFPAVDETALAHLFGAATGDDIDKFGRCAWTPGPDGVPLLDRSPVRFIGRRVGRLFDAAGDHTCLVLDPIDVAPPIDANAPFTPLRFDAVSDVRAGHPPGEGHGG